MTTNKQRSSRYCGVCGKVQEMLRRSDGYLNCIRCGTIYDDDPDEGGVALHSDPGKSLDMKEWEERRRKKEEIAKRQQQLRGGRRQ